MMLFRSSALTARPNDPMLVPGQNIAVGTGAVLALAAEGAIAGDVSAENLAAYAVTGGQKERLRQRRSKVRDQAQPGPVRNIQDGRHAKTGLCGLAMPSRKMRSDD